jgi:hypothetical protein
MKATFVWIAGNRGPVPQIWYTAQKREKFDRPVLAKHKISAEIAKLPITELEAIFPAPEVK